VVAGGPLAISDDVDELRDLARPTLALYFGGMGARGRNYYNDVLRRYGFEHPCCWTDAVATFGPPS
jgi:hypothetical protein